MNDQSENTAGGALGRLAGKAKAAAGAALGNEELAREGRLQEAQSDAEREAAREREQARLLEEEADSAGRRAELMREREQLHGELATEEREAAIERDRQLAEAAAERRAAREQVLA
ncbi:MAG: CsbD family protein, partial [Solirubrobacterales bacterium]|nr:CsbD family protein [Solirubrobacterales bacterium]